MDRTLDDILSEAQYTLRDGYRDYMSNAIARARNVLNNQPCSRCLWHLALPCEMHRQLSPVSVLHGVPAGHYEVEVDKQGHLSEPRYRHPGKYGTPEPPRGPITEDQREYQRQVDGGE